MRIEEREREETFESTIGRRHCLIDIGEEETEGYIAEEEVE